MNRHKHHWPLIGVLLIAAVIAVGIPVTSAQNEGVINLYSVWVNLSLRGHPQEEIESLLRNMDPDRVDDVKARLRRSVMANLEIKRIGSRYRSSRDQDDLNGVTSTIQTELRVASLENDPEVRMMIKDRFGIPFTQF